MKNVKRNTLLIGVLALLIANYHINAEELGSHDAETPTTNANRIKTLHLDDVTVTWVADNAQETFMPRTLFKDASEHLIKELSLQDGIPSSISTFLVESNGLRILFDTGFGKPGSQLLTGLQTLGIKPADVKYLYLTHFHGDHIGGMMKGDSVVFPNAEIHASRVEYEAWMKMSSDKNIQQVKTMNAYKKHLHLFEYGDTLPGNIVAMDAIGHTPGHTAYRAGRLLVIGDLIHGAALQLKHPDICASYDMDKDMAIKSRKRILKYAKENHLVMAGMHLPGPAFQSFK